MTKLSYAWVRNTPLFKSVSTGLTFDEKHLVAVLLMNCILSHRMSAYNMMIERHDLLEFLLDMAIQHREVTQCKTTTKQ